MLDASNGHHSNAVHRQWQLQKIYNKVAIHWRVVTIYLFLWWVLVGMAVSLLAGGYAVFYHWYIPAERILNPVYLQFGHAKGPSASIDIIGARSGVLYDVSLQLFIPDMAGLSEALGNIMISTNLTSGGLELASARPTLLAYRSWPVRMTLLAFRLVPVVFGLAQEATLHRIFLLEAVALPEAKVQIQISLDQKVPIYAATLELVAHFNGLRYFMYYWRWAFAAAVIGVASSLAIITISIALAVSLYLRIDLAGQQGKEKRKLALESSELSSFSNGHLVNGTSTSLSSSTKSFPNPATALYPALRRRFISRDESRDLRVPNGSTFSDSDSDSEPQTED